MVVTRFAPSPTGDLHIGSVRVALYSWLYAKKTGGKFILRIEDTDRERSTQEAVDVILEGMTWLGLHWDLGPYFQTEHFDRYKAVIDDLLLKGHAYKCYCSKERLETLRDAQMAAKEKPKYDGLCRDLIESKEGPYVIRFKNPETGSVVFEDAVRGRIEVKNEELDDLIIARSDGTPTYNLTVVVDDWDMGVTHVLRGDDHINNTPRQINLLLAMGAEVPIYGHLPMILGPDGKRLSKRHGAVSVLEYRFEGILPEALLNYLVRLGWSHGDQEIFTIEEMIKHFDISGINRSPSAFNHEKLLWLNQHYIKTLPPARVARYLISQFERLKIDVSQGPLLEDLIVLQADRCKTLSEMAENSRYFYENDILYDEKAVEKVFGSEALMVLGLVYEKLSGLRDWTGPVINDSIRSLGEAHDLGLGKIMQPIRLAVTGGTSSPSIDMTLALLGREKSLARLDSAIKMIKTPKES